jgi:hypothetical protein
MNLPPRLLWLPLLLVTLSGCDSEQTVADPNLSGRYEGFGGGYTWTVDLSDADGELTGTGTVETGSETFPVAVEGATTFPVVGFALDAEGLDLFTFDGRVSGGGDILTGTLASGDGFSAEIAFQRE